MLGIDFGNQENGVLVFRGGMAGDWYRGRGGGRRKRGVARKGRRRRRTRNSFYTSLPRKVLESAGTIANISTTVVAQEAAFNHVTVGTTATTRLGQRIWTSGFYLNLTMFYDESETVKSQMVRLMFIRSKLENNETPVANFNFPTYNGCISELFRSQAVVMWDQLFVISRDDIDQRIQIQKAFRVRKYRNYASVDDLHPINKTIYMLVAIGDTPISTTPDIIGNVCHYFVDAL